MEVRVSDSTAIVRFQVLPLRPEGTEGFSEEELAALVTRDAMIDQPGATLRPHRGHTATATQAARPPQA